MQTIEIKKAEKQIAAEEAMLQNSSFSRLCLNNSTFTDVAMVAVKITNANMSNIEIEGAQLGGAYLHNIGMPPKGHPAHGPAARQAPLKFDNCDLAGSSITNCDLSNIDISNCNISGMKINGLEVAELLKSYNKSNG